MCILDGLRHRRDLSLQNQHRNFRIYSDSTCHELAAQGPPSNISQWNADDSGGGIQFVAALYELNSFRKIFRPCLPGVVGVDCRYRVCPTYGAGGVARELELAGRGLGNMPVRRNRCNSSIW